MGRKHVTPIQQPTDNTCGPTALKMALHILGAHESLSSLIKRCKTTRNGTTTENLIHAMTDLGYYVLAIEYATLRHITSALHYPPNKVRAIMVTYLYDLDEKNRPHPDSGHWATVSSYLSSKNRIVLFDSTYAERKSYQWQDFRSRWMDYDLKRKKLSKTGKKFRLVKHWQQQLMLVVAKEKDHLPKFSQSATKLFSPSSSDEV